MSVSGRPIVVELAVQVLPVAGQARVDERDALGRIDEVGRDDVVAQAVQVRRELHGDPFRWWW